MPIQLDIKIARYEDGQWVRLPYSKQYERVNAHMLSITLPPYTQHEQVFPLSLNEMVKGRLKSGKYRLEKQINRDWYFAEFEVY